MFLHTYYYLIFPIKKVRKWF